MSFRKRNSHTKSKRADSTKIHVVVRVRPRIGGGPRLHHPQAAGRLGVRGVRGGGRGALVGLPQEAVLRHARVRLRLRARPRRDAGAGVRGGRARRGRRRDGGLQRHDPRVRADGDGQDAHDLRPALVLAAARAHVVDRAVGVGGGVGARGAIAGGGACCRSSSSRGSSRARRCRSSPPSTSAAPPTPRARCSSRSRSPRCRSTKSRRATSSPIRRTRRRSRCARTPPTASTSRGSRSTR